jgi:hypothetical protein
MAEGAAFAAAVERLGAPAVIEREFVAAMSPTKQLLALCRKPFRIFPTNLTVCAWASLLIGGATILNGFNHAIANRLSPGEFIAGLHHLNALVLIILSFFATGLLGVTSGTAYLRSRSQGSAIRLAAFWVIFFWALGTLLILQIIHLGEPAFHPESWPPLFMTPVAIVAFFGWRSRICAMTAKRSLSARGSEKIPSPTRP